MTVEVHQTTSARGGANARWKWYCEICDEWSEKDYGFKSTAAGLGLAHDSNVHRNQGETMKITKAEAIKTRIDMLERELMKIESQPEEPISDEMTVIWFEKRFDEFGRLYTYAAVRVDDGLWYTTGPRSPKGYSWDDLLDFIGDGEIWYGLTWEQVQ